VEEQIELFELFLSEEKEVAKMVRKCIAEHNKPPKPVKEKEPKAPRKGKGVVHQDTLISQLIQDANAEIGENIEQSNESSNKEDSVKIAKEAEKLAKEEADNASMKEFITPVTTLGEQMTQFTMEIGMKGMQNPDEVGAAAVDYLRVAGHRVFGYFWARMAQVALREIAAGNKDPFYQAKLQTARFYFAKLLPETATLMQTARAGSAPLMDTEAVFA
jgi:hypothetical protein